MTKKALDVLCRLDWRSTSLRQLPWPSERSRNHGFSKITQGLLTFGEGNHPHDHRCTYGVIGTLFLAKNHFFLAKLLSDVWFWQVSFGSYTSVRLNPFYPMLLFSLLTL
jgi:hypothetical protein